MLTGIKNLLGWLNENWTVIIIIIGLGVALYEKVKNYLSKTNEEKIAIAKQQIGEICLKLIADAEIDYETWHKAGSIKRAQVIQQIFAEYPILSKVTDQQQLIQWIDESIDAPLKQLREIVSKNTEVEKHD